MTNKQRLVYSIIIALSVLAIMLGLSHLQNIGVLSENERTVWSRLNKASVSLSRNRVSAAVRIDGREVRKHLGIPRRGPRYS